MDVKPGRCLLPSHIVERFESTALGYALRLSKQYARPIDNMVHKALTTAHCSTYLFAQPDLRSTNPLVVLAPHLLSQKSLSLSLSLSLCVCVCLKITNRLFRYATPHFWNQLPVSFRQPCINHSAGDVTLSLFNFHLLIILTLHHAFTISSLKTHLSTIFSTTLC